MTTRAGHSPQPGQPSAAQDPEHVDPETIDAWLAAQRHNPLWQRLWQRLLADPSEHVEEPAETEEEVA